MPASVPGTVSRFAPSPTGFLHIGGARTALFNHYFALSSGGEMRLRIEDTDLKRSTDEAKQAILDGLEWLGVPHAGEITYQSERADRHREVAEQLVASGAAYRCYMSDDFEAQYKAMARADDRGFRSHHRDGRKSDTARDDDSFVVRFRVPDGSTTIADAVQGEVTWDNAQFDDLVLLRRDGSPTYMLAVVADDHDMGVTHVLRGDDHLINAGRQQLIYEALGWEVPTWAHVPLIHGPDGKKLSKRHGALGVEGYREMGYLPSALRNYLVRLGWAHGDDEIFFDDASIAKVFSLDGLNSAPARLDFDKLDYVNQQHIEHLPADELLAHAAPFLEAERGQALSQTELARIREALPTLRPRAKTLIELARVAGYLFDVEPITLAGKWAKPLRREGAGDLVSELTSRLQSLEGAQWTSPSLHAVLQDFVTEREIGFGQVGGPVRAALTRGLPSPDLSDVMAFLGQTETLARLDDAMRALNATE